MPSCRLLSVEPAEPGLTDESPALVGESLDLYELAIIRMSLGDGPPVKVMTLSLLLLPSCVSLGDSDTDS